MPLMVFLSFRKPVFVVYNKDDLILSARQLQQLVRCTCTYISSLTALNSQLFYLLCWQSVQNYVFATHRTRRQARDQPRDDHLLLRLQLQTLILSYFPLKGVRLTQQHRETRFLCMITNTRISITWRST